MFWDNVASLFDAGRRLLPGGGSSGFLASLWWNTHMMHAGKEAVVFYCCGLP